MIDLDKLEKLASAATPGPWHRSDRPAGPFWHIYADHTVGGEPCVSGKQSIGTMHAENKRTGSKAYAAMFESNASFVAAANPAAILELIAEVRALRAKLETPIAMKIKWSPIESSMMDGWAQDVAEDALRRGRKVTAYYGEVRPYTARGAK